MAEAAQAVVQQAKDSGVWVFRGGLHSYEEVSVVATDGMVTDGPYRSALANSDAASHSRCLGFSR